VTPRWRWLLVPFQAALDGLRHFFAFYRWMTEWDQPREPAPAAVRSRPYRQIAARLAMELLALVLLLGLLLAIVQAGSGNLSPPRWVNLGIGLGLVAAGIAGQRRLPTAYRPSVTLFGGLSAGVVIFWSAALSPADGQTPLVEASLSVERSILRYTLIAAVLFLARDALFAFRPLLDWRKSAHPGFETATGILAMALIVPYVWNVAPDLPSIILCGLTIAILFIAALIVAKTPDPWLPRLALILIPVAAVTTWVHLAWTPWVTRIEHNDASRTAEISTLIALVFLYELATARYRRRREKQDQLQATSPAKHQGCRAV
jgi:hypothetical protein